ncbi:MAG: hypothetical protein CM1200mP3_05970 [Chloroflexota bacterium]|nr:MAG: hypothetical protein CM1200mP3_05970 [Chloroflexota bacterium]
MCKFMCYKCSFFGNFKILKQGVKDKRRCNEEGVAGPGLMENLGPDTNVIYLKKVDNLSRLPMVTDPGSRVVEPYVETDNSVETRKAVSDGFLAIHNITSNRFWQFALYLGLCLYSELSDL